MLEDQTAEDELGSFLGENAEYFIRLFQPVAETLGHVNGIKVISEEGDYTVAVASRVIGDDGELDVDCVILDPHQESLSDCLNALDLEEGSVS
ncbi:MAG: hypothetical protein ACPG32_05260 [Akkermansiaceae bacterium]